LSINARQKQRIAIFNPNNALGFDEEPQDRDAERFKGFAVHTNCGMDKKPESLYAREIAVIRKVLMHYLGLILTKTATMSIFFTEPFLYNGD
jgi:hypothetical protein